MKFVLNFNEVVDSIMSNSQDYNLLASQLTPRIMEDMNYFLVEDDGSAFEFENHPDFKTLFDPVAELRRKLNADDRALKETAKKAGELTVSELRRKLSSPVEESTGWETVLLDPEDPTWSGWNPGTSQWQMRSHPSGQHLLRFRRRDGETVEILLDQPEVHALHRLLENDALGRYLR